MVQERLPKATHAGEMKIGDLTIPCAVLEDGRRVLTQRGLQDALGMGTGGGRAGERKMVEFAAKLAGNGCNVAQLTASANAPIRMTLPRGGAAFSYPAEILAEVCEAVLSSRDSGAFPPDHAIVLRCDRLLRGFARVGIVALIDEATGYQVDRKRDELQKILAAYVSPELLPWSKQFPDEFYEQVYRLFEWPWDSGTSAKPGVVGHFTNMVVYERLPDGVLEVLQAKNPTTSPGQRKDAHHQWLTKEYGKDQLQKHLSNLIVLMKAAKTRQGFLQSVMTVWPKPNDQQYLLRLDDLLADNPRPK